VIHMQVSDSITSILLAKYKTSRCFHPISSTAITKISRANPHPTISPLMHDVSSHPSHQQTTRKQRYFHIAEDLALQRTL
jgi:hypothetical protein